MALVTENTVLTAANRAKDAQKVHRTSGRILVKDAQTTKQQFDIFLSHSIKDANIVLGSKRLLEELGKSVYVDWVTDPNLDRSMVSPETAYELQKRMNQCEALFYLYSSNSTSSRWMPWELVENASKKCTSDAA